MRRLLLMTDPWPLCIGRERMSFTLVPSRRVAHCSPYGPCFLVRAGPVKGLGVGNSGGIHELSHTVDRHGDGGEAFGSRAGNGVGTLNIVDAAGDAGEA